MLRTSLLLFFRENCHTQNILLTFFHDLFVKLQNSAFCETHFHENIFASNSSCIVSCNTIIHSPSRNGIIIAFSHNTAYWSGQGSALQRNAKIMTLCSNVSGPHLLLCGSWSLLFSIWIRIRGGGLKQDKSNKKIIIS